MRVLVVRPGPHYSVLDVHRKIVKGLEANGCTVADFRYDDLLDLFGSAAIKRGSRWKSIFDDRGASLIAAEWLQAALYRVWPDVVVLTSAFWVPPETLGILRKRPHHVVLWATESPYEDDKQLRLAEWVDTVVVNDPMNLGAYRDVNPRTWYLPHAYEPDIHRPGPPDPDLACDVAFVGTGFPSRIEFIRSIDWTGIDLRLAGFWLAAMDDPWIVERLLNDPNAGYDNDQTVRLYNSAKASWNTYRREATWEGGDQGWAMGPREVELAASGTFFLRESRPEGDEVLHMLPTFTDAWDFGDKLRWWLDHDAERDKAARMAMEAVADRTPASITAQLLRLVESAPTRIP